MYFTSQDNLLYSCYLKCLFQVDETGRSQEGKQTATHPRSGKQPTIRYCLNKRSKACSNAMKCYEYHNRGHYIELLSENFICSIIISNIAVCNCLNHFFLIVLKRCP